MTSLAAELSRIAGKAFAAEGLSEDFGRVAASDRPDLAQFQCNGALAAAKISKSNPRAIAEKIAGRLKAQAIFSKVEIAGPGFLNLDLTDEALNARAALLAKRDGPAAANGKTAVIDFGGPNIAKPMAVHHLRSSIIGDCLQRLYRANGWKVISDVHLGDWGLQMGQLISEIEIRGLAPVYFDAAFTGPYPEVSPVSMEDLEDALSARFRRLQGRSGAAGKRRAAPRWICRPAGPAIARCGGISSRSRKWASPANSPAWG